MINKNIISRAQEFARNAHEPIFAITIAGVKRPQIMHIQEVADLVWASGGSDEEITAAWLHDSVEDTQTSLNDIEKHFGKMVMSIVHGLTDLDEFKNLPLPERKRRQAERVRSESDSVRRVKIADQTSNVRFLATDPTNSMTFDECGQYIQGAKLIADECKGISPLLDKLFNEAYLKGLKRYFPS
ncbi:MAG: HD domain-containing protein [Candidatus Paceibacterota bacterium]|jgi:guanosine-3',5'-bis(diphosphate) 3'-pyrophosphohydrolase